MRLPSLADQRSLRGLASACLTGAFLLTPAVAWPSAQAQNTAEATAVVTALPKSGDAPPINQQQIVVAVDGKQVSPTMWRAYGRGPVQLVLLMDSSLRTSVGREFEELGKFFASLPPNVSVAVAYMQNGRAVFSGGAAGAFTSDHTASSKQLRLPGGSAGSNASPYFCLSDLAKRWPAPRSEARREVVMITDGVDEYNPRYDPSDPYVRSAVDDAERAGLVTYAIYYRNQGRQSGTSYETDAGQNYLTQVAEETGGTLYYQGLGNPVSFAPFLEDLGRRLMNQYELGVPVQVRTKDAFADLKVRTAVTSLKITAPKRLAVAGQK